MEVLMFIIPFLLASILLGMTCSTFFYHRENAIPFFIFMSIPILLMTGLPWPRESMPIFWKNFSYLFPATFAANGFVRMGTMGANLVEVSKENLSLWILVAVYLTTTFFAYRWRLLKGWRLQERKERRSRRLQSRRNRIKHIKKSNNQL